MRRDRGGAPRATRRGPGAADAHRDVECGAGTILNDAPCGVAESSPVAIQRRRHRRGGGRRPAGRPLRARPAERLGRCPAGAAGRASTVGSGQGCQRQPRRRDAGDGRQRGRGPREPARRLDRLGRTPTVTSTSAPGTRPRRSTAATTPTRRTGPRCGTRSSPTRPPTPPPTAASRRRSPIADGGSLVEGGSLGQETYALEQRERRAGHRLAAVLRRQRVLHRRRGRPLRHGLGRLRRRRRLVGRVRPRDALRQRRHVRDLQRPRRADLQRQHDEEVDSSPAVGPILPGGCLRDRHRHGQLLRRAPATRTRSRSTTPSATRSGATRSTASTGGSPALADVQGNGQLAVVEGTVHADGSGLGLGAQRGHAAPPSGTPTSAGAVYGSVTTADLTGSGSQDVIVPTDQGLYILDGPTGAEVAARRRRLGQRRHRTTGRDYGFQNAALVTADADGVDRHHGGRLLRIQVNGGNYVQGIVQHFEVDGLRLGQRRRAPAGGRSSTTMRR